MNIKELIASTNKVPNRGEAKALKKKFGSIYAYNKNVTILRGGNVITFNMIIGGVTDMIKAGGKRRPVAFHKVAIALNVGKDAKKDYTTAQLLDAVRAKFPKFKDAVDQDVLKAVLEKPDGFFDNATVFKTTNAEGYAVISNNISDDCEIQVWCSCSDYYWTFQYFNIRARNKNKSSVNLYGSANYPRVYNPRSDRKPRNPSHSPGMCKHLMLLLGMLMQDEVVQDTKNGLKKYYNLNYNKFIKNNVKELIPWNYYIKQLHRYQKDHDIMNEQRNTIHYQSGNKIERKNFAQSGRLPYQQKGRK